MASFALPSILSVLATYVVLRWSQRAELTDPCESDVEQPGLSVGGWTALAGIGVTAVALLAVSALNLQLGAPTCLLGVMTTAIVLMIKRAAPWPVVRSVSWSVLPLVAGLFVLVEALDMTGLVAALAGLLRTSPLSTVSLAGLSSAILAVASNLINNLPAGLIASTTIAQAHPPQTVTDALLIGVDLGPNLSITGSLATILWLTAIRREGETVGFWRFLRVGALVAPPALVLAVVGRLLAARQGRRP